MCFNKPCWVPPPHLPAPGERAKGSGWGTSAGSAATQPRPPAAPVPDLPVTASLRPKSTLLGIGCREQPNSGQLNRESPVDSS